MPLFQRAPETAEEMEKHPPLDLSPDEVNELDEDAWYERVYRGDDAPQLTVRAVGVGAALGFFLALTNLYIGLKIGWHLGVALTACILSFSLWTAIHKAGLSRTPMSILENNCMASTASAAGYSTGSILASSIPALLLLSVTPENPAGIPLPVPVLAAWVFFLALLGTSLAIPMKRNMVNREKLRFPSGMAAAVLLKSLHDKGGDAIAKGRALLYAALAAGLVPVLKDLEAWKGLDDKGQLARHALLPASLKIFDWLPGITAAGKKAALSAWNVKLDYGPALIAAGALVGLRVTLSMVAGGLFLVLFLGPRAIEATWTNPLGAVVAAAKGPASAWKDIGVWVGAPLMVSSGILSFAFEWRTIVRAFTGMGGQGASERSARIEVPNRWFAAGATFAGLGIVILAQRFFGIPLHFGVLAVLMTFVLALVACRATGESDITPTGAMGKIMQLTYGVLMTQNASANLMTAGITAGSSSAAADLLTDLKSGYLLGANPRRQYLAQLMGVLPGTAATVIGYSILVPNAAALTGSEGHDPAFPAPAAQSWLAVAKVFKLGIGNMHPMAQQGIFYGLVAGVILVLLERALPKYKKWLPSPTGIGLGLILPFYQPLAMFIGAVLAAVAGRTKGSRMAELVVPVASGLIAGESIVGVVVAALNNFVLK
jgi:uncharacterized oligopeptide transporter (OPT) family protein